MAAKYCVGRTNGAAFEWLDRKPVWSRDGAGDPTLVVVWTSAVSKALGFTRAAAGEWAEMIPDASLVRFGDAEPDETIDFAAQEAARCKEARKRHVEAMTPAERAAEGLS